MKFRAAILFLSIMAFSSCSGNAEPENGDGGGASVPEGYVTVKITSDRSSVIKNPMTGWVMYVSGTSDPSYFDTEFVTSSGKTVKVRDYASCFYVRTGWKNFNPAEGKYFWQDPDSQLYKLYKRGQELGLPMAFRVVIDGRDQGENTPQWVFDKGAKYWLEDSDFLDRKTPLATDKVWRECYEKFIEDFAKEFNDPDKLAFIDGYGLGKWGEGHNVCYEQGNAETAKTPEYKKETMEWITGLYSRCFTKVPLAINYHRHIGAPKSEGEKADDDSEELLQIAIDNGYCLRSDAFGMLNKSWGYNDWERGFVAKWNFKLPVILEGGYVLSNASHQGSMKEDGYDSPYEVREGEFKEGEKAFVNMMDFRVGDETRSWFEDAFKYVERFAQEGGYRLYPEYAAVPEHIALGSDADVTLTSTWRNIGWGYCPTNLLQWNQKYKVAYALLDMQTEQPVYEFVVEDSDLSKWLSSSPVEYSSEFSMKKVSIGGYIWAVGIVDVSKTDDKGLNPAGIRLAANKKFLSSDGFWVKLANVTVN